MPFLVESSLENEGQDDLFWQKETSIEEGFEGPSVLAKAS